MTAAPIYPLPGAALLSRAALGLSASSIHGTGSAEQGCPEQHQGCEATKFPFFKAQVQENCWHLHGMRPRPPAWDCPSFSTGAVVGQRRQRRQRSTGRSRQLGAERSPQKRVLDPHHEQNYCSPP